MKKVCSISQVEFEVSESALEFYKRMGVPPPSLCPDERARRRMSYANQRHLFARTCPATQKRIITSYPPELPLVVYDIAHWWSDKWDQHQVAREYDFSRTFFSQFSELLTVAPRPSLLRGYEFDENSDYTNHAGQNKNCYLIFDSDNCRDCLFSYSINHCLDCADCFRCEKSELCYECIDCLNCYSSCYLQNCESCSESFLLKNCIGCSHCFGSYNLRNKKYCYFNQQLSAEEYASKLRDHQLHNRSQVESVVSFAEDQFSKQWQRATQGAHNEGCCGDYLNHSKNAWYCFDSRQLWDCAFISQAFGDCKDSIDCTEVGQQAELLYETAYAGFPANNLRFCCMCYPQVSNLTYVYGSAHVSDLFGCAFLHHKKYCILNKQYSKDDYDVLVPKIIAQMKTNSEWGEFFPAEMSPYPYNLSHANDFMPLTEQQALARGLRWYRWDQQEFKLTGDSPPEEATMVSNVLVGKVYNCAVSKKAYRITAQEVKIYQKLSLPMPQYCPEQRYLHRLAKRPQRKLRQAHCGLCQTAVWTSMPETQNRIACEACFGQLAS